MNYPPALKRLIELLSQWPTVGPKTAERYAFYLFRQNPEKLQSLAQAIAELKEKTVVCSGCLAVAESDPCPICADPSRDRSLMAIVAQTQDLLALEATGQYRGLYFVLGGTIDAVAGTSPSDLNLDKLAVRLKAGAPKEVILALDPTIEGETTSLFLAKRLKTDWPRLRITRLARGLPMGADLEYADHITLTNALKFRNEMK